MSAVPTPPADDVRDRLVIRHVGGNTLGGTVEQVLSTHLAKGWSVESFEVRPRGTVTDAEVEAAARSLASLAPGEEWPSNETLGGNATGTRDDEYRETLRDIARDVLAAAREVQP